MRQVEDLGRGRKSESFPIKYQVEYLIWFKVGPDFN